MSNYIDSIQLSGTVYTIQGSGGGNATVELTQAEYDALVSAGTVSANTYYIITDATPIDVSNYWTSAQTQSAITEATSGKVDTSTYNTYTAATDTALASKQTTLTAGTGISIVDNVISATGGGGGKAIEAGRGITVTTGETADTVSFNLPIYDRGNYSVSECHNENSNVPSCLSNYCHLEHSSGTIGSNSNSSHKEGVGSKIGDYSNNSHVEGYKCEVGTLSPFSHAEGQYTKTSNQSEHASGQYNVSNKANYTWGNSGNTLFSVGNGTSTNARHNAFEIRQNGDIYLTKDGVDIKLQDNLGGGEASSAITSGDTNAVAGGAVYDKFDEVEQVTARALNNINDRLSEDEEVTAAGLNAVNSALGGLKLQQITQSAYDALVTKDASTLYIIVN